MNVKSGFLSGLESETGTKAGLMAAESRGGGGALDNSACSGDGLHVSTSESSLSGQTDYITKKKKELSWNHDSRTGFSDGFFLSLF